MENVIPKNVLLTEKFFEKKMPELFKNFEKPLDMENKIKEFIGKDDIYIDLNNGMYVIVDFLAGKVTNEKLYIIKLLREDLNMFNSKNLTGKIANVINNKFQRVVCMSVAMQLL